MEESQTFHCQRYLILFDDMCIYVLYYIVLCLLFGNVRFNIIISYYIILYTSNIVLAGFPKEFSLLSLKSSHLDHLDPGDHRGREGQRDGRNLRSPA